MDHQQNLEIVSTDSNRGVQGQASSGTAPEAEFIPPRHWIGPEELDPGYWSDPGIQERRAQEFHEKPVEWLEMMDKTGKTGMARREFLTVMGASMAMATFSCARRPVHKIIPYAIRPEEITPGVATYYASTSKECRCGCGLLVKTREGRPIKLEGNPDDPTNRGTLCAQGQASLLNLYDVDRLTQPLARDRGSSSTRKIGWADIDRAIQGKLNPASRVRVLSGEIFSPSTEKLIGEFLGAFSNGTHIQYEPVSYEDLSQAQNLSYGTALIPHYHFEKAEVIVSLGADFLTSWLSPTEFNGQWVKNRKLESGDPARARLSKFYCFEPSVTTTGASADERFPIRPGDELKIVMALAYELLINQKRSSWATDAATLSALASYRPEGVARDVGIQNGAEKFREIASNLWKARGRSLVVGGGLQSQTVDAIALQNGVNLLNSVLENEGVTVDGTAGFREQRVDFTAFQRLVSDMKAGSVDVLIVYRSNPMFTAPRALLGLEDAIKKVPLVIAITDREDETARLADYVLPDHHYLENWGDSSVWRGVYGIQQPAVSPIFDTRAFEDTLLTWIKGAGLKVQGLSAQAVDWHGYLQANWKATLFKQENIAGDFETFWEGVLRDGVFVPVQAANARPSARKFRSSALTGIPKFAPAAPGILLSLYQSIQLGDGRHANNAWLQELPDSIAAISWDNFLNLGVGVARDLGVGENDVVEVKTGDISVELPVHVQPGMHPLSVSVAIGYGRRSVGKVGNQAGVDVYPFVKVENGRQLYAGFPVLLRKTGRLYRLASTQWTTTTQKRPVINDITFAEYKSNPAAHVETDPELRLETVPTLWPKHKYTGYRWGMAIDLNSCTSCGACVVACMAENNIPVVGREQVRASRDMHWIRIDRYYTGSPDNPGLVFQPMLCQQCENAPCETVCPVLATTHDDEGLNLMTYNRCVGTRYCQNNCPYKVRRFNFFDHWKSYQGTMNLVWNPDVTVRSRGIMEKCTFCVQRIQDAKNHAKDLNLPVKDGELKTACQQTCPTSAITFGNINSPATLVSRLRADARAFRVLENLNTVPSISYLSKVRNVEGG